MVANEKLDAKNFDDPIKTIISDQHMIHFDPSDLTYFNVQIEKNKYEIDDGYVLSNFKDGNLYQVGKTSQSTVRRSQKQSNLFFQGFFLLSSESKIFTSRTYKFLDALGTIGGVYELLFSILYLVFGFVSRKLYFYYMVNRLKGFESRYKNEHQGAGQSRADRNSQNMNRSLRYAENVQNENVYSSIVRSINNIRHYSKTRNKLKNKKLNSQK